MSRAAPLAVGLLLLAGCTPGGDDVGTRAEHAAVPPAGATAPAASPPLTALQASVDLTPAMPGVAVAPLAAVPAPDGRVFVLEDPLNRERPMQLATVTPDGSGSYTVTASVPVPRLRDVYGLHVLPDGSVLVAGQFALPTSGYGFTVVDPAAGVVRSSTVVPYETGTQEARGRSALSPDGRTLFLYLRTDVDDRPLDLLLAVDPASGRLHAGRDLYEEVRDVSVHAASTAWLVPRADGGVRVVFSADPREGDRRRVPTLLAYGPDLEPDGAAVALAPLSDDARVAAVAAGADGTVYVATEQIATDRLLALSPAGTVAAVATLGGTPYHYALVVEPGWMLLPDPAGALAVSFASGASTRVDVGCPSGLDVRDLVPAAGARVLLIGRCDAPQGGKTPMLWLTAPGSA